MKEIPPTKEKYKVGWDFVNRFESPWNRRRCNVYSSPSPALCSSLSLDLCSGRRRCFLCLPSASLDLCFVAVAAYAEPVAVTIICSNGFCSISNVIATGSNSNPQRRIQSWFGSRDQRVKDNWALIHAVHQANKSNVPVAVVFNLFDQFLGAKSRHLGFMLRGLRRVSDQLHQTLQIPFFLLRGEAEETVPKFLSECGASMLVTDFSPLREVRRCKEEICKKVNESLTVHEVDAHNIVPLWVASEKLEYSAKTIRGKINKKLSEYLIDFPTIEPQTRKWTITKNHSVDWDDLIADILRLVFGTTLLASGF
ncbi:hypothetical protein Ahy_A03g014117 isoform B [Arachis hypogaea]|uniref:Photolyase/cryptochrome alpha/beta domain-containing protein n=1 Tax=Arachis hypogaea TaxID=3818 RepID=A0A445DX34_ARAHY|nr:hypothetical protein Ahy_A03g014117 isoform B [Arachis hypogaea]